MRSSKRLMLIITISVLAFGTCAAQSRNRHSDEILTRISYRSTYGVDWREPQDSPQICFALYRIGYYRLSKMTENGTRAFQGTLSKDQLSRVNEMLKKLHPQKREDGIIREGSESVMVEITTSAKRYTWTDADHRSPFPESLLELVRWLQLLRTEDEAPLRLRERSFHLSGGFRKTAAADRGRPERNLHFTNSQEPIANRGFLPRLNRSPCRRQSLLQSLQGWNAAHACVDSV